MEVWQALLYVMAMNLFRHLPILLASFLFLVPPAAQAKMPPDDFHSIGLSIENDLFSDTDRHYTSGVRISYMPPETALPLWLDDTISTMPGFSRDGHKRLGFSLGQSMFTPANIRTATPDPADRPYAGWLFGSAGVMSDTGKRLDRLEITLGMVGPASLADEAQTFIHDLEGGQRPQGWQYQLENEPGIVLSYERKWRSLYEFSPFGLGADITPHMGVSGGNVYTYAAAGGTVRVGQDLPSDYGPPLIRPSVSGSDFFRPADSFGWYLFAGVEGRAVARNIFLDGNSFSASRHVDKENFVGDFQAGLAVTFDHVRLSYTHIFRSREFTGQDGNNSYGALALSTRF